MAEVNIYSSDYCPYCQRAKALLRERGDVTDDYEVDCLLEEICVDGKPAERAAMAQLVGRTSVPQIFIGGQHVGGCDDLHALDARGGLQPLLDA